MIVNTKTLKLYKKVFPRALYFIDETAKHLSECTFTSSPDISRLKNNPSAMFEYIQSICDESLKLALDPFMKSENVTLSALMRKYHYNYKDLRIICLYKTFDNLLDSFSTTNQSKIVDELTDMYSSNNSDTCRHRIDNLSKDKNKREEEHKAYFGFPEDVHMKLNSKDIAYYQCELNNKRVKDFLFTNDIEVNTDFINKLQYFYDDIDQETGFNKFQLEYHLEFDCGINYFISMLNVVKNPNKKTSSSDSCPYTELEILRMIVSIFQQPFWNKDTELKLYKIDNNKVMNVYRPYNIYINELYDYIIKSQVEKTIVFDESYYNGISLQRNFIPFGLYDIYEYVRTESIGVLEEIKGFMHEMNTAVYTASHFVSMIMTELLIDCNTTVEDLKKYKKKEIYAINKEITQYIKKVLSCDIATETFNKFMDQCSKRPDYRSILKSANQQKLLKLLNTIYLAK